MFNASFEYAKDEIDRRLKNPFWGSFVLAWLGWNWKVWYITIFVDDKLIGNKIEYIEKMYTYFNFYHTFPFLGFVFNWIIAPIFIGFLVIWFLPKVTDEFLQKQQKNKEREDNILLKNLGIEKQILEEKEKVAEQTLQTFEKEGAIKKVEQENQFVIWDKEYESINLNILEILSLFIYEDRGEIRIFNNGNRNISGKDLSQLDAYGLVKNIDQGIYEITDKGRYFLRKLSLEK